MKTITDPQLEHLRDLSNKVHALAPQNPPIAEEHLTRFTAQEASALISAFRLRLEELRRQARTQRQNQVEETLTEETFYVTGDGTTYRTRRARGSGKLYALRLVETSGETPRLEYDKGAIFRLTPDDEADPDQAREIAARYGHQTGQCMICGRTLTNPESIEVGIGPICVKRV